MTVNLTEKGTELGAFLDAIESPLTSFLFALGIVFAILGLVWAIVNVIGKSVGNMKKGGK